MRIFIILSILMLIQGCYTSKKPILTQGVSIDGFQGKHLVRVINVNDNKQKQSFFSVQRENTTTSKISVDYRVSSLVNSEQSAGEQIEKSIRFKPVPNTSNNLFILQTWDEENEAYIITIAKKQGTTLSIMPLMRLFKETEEDAFFRKIIEKHDVSISQPDPKKAHLFFAPELIGNRADIENALMEIAITWNEQDLKSYPAIEFTPQATD